MVDALSVVRRSENMRRITSKNTKPEMLVRRLVHGMGFRYRLHVKTLPGKPDLVFSKRLKAIFVHGCFWHQHNQCREGRVPSSREDYWRPKLERNVQRDKKHVRRLRREGWSVLTVWECQLRDTDLLKRKLRNFLNDD
jgi:DNA mismatch endonuclease, patch repair protein